MLVYLVLRRGQCVYVGQTTQALANRKGKHLSDARKGRGAVLGAAIRKHGELEFAWVAYIKCSSQAELDLEEKRLIAELKPKYNLQKGGKTGFDTWNKGKKETRPHVLKNISLSAKTRKRTPRGKYSASHVEKISRTSKERYERPFVCHQTGEVFYNKITCAEKLGLNPSSLSVLLGRYSRLKSLKGYTFAYLDFSAEKPTLIDLETLEQGNKGQGQKPA